jgi:MerR family transcriptional regulator, light-induced transcriptional regulator
MSKELSNRIKELRKKKGYTQKELADLLGVGQTTVANYEQGIRVPDTDKLNKLADLFKVTLDYLLGRDEKKEEINKKTDTVIKEPQNISEVYKVFLEMLLKGNREEARRLAVSIYEEGANISKIYFEVLEMALKEVGVLWEQGIIDVWKEHFISEAVMDIMRELKVKQEKLNGKGNSLLALTSGPELHNIGLRMITDLLELDGWQVVYLGSNVPVQSLIKAIEIEKPDVVAISVTLPYHIESAKYTIAAVKNYFGRKSPKIIVGGAAFCNIENAVKETGADYYGISIEDIKAVTEK